MKSDVSDDAEADRQSDPTEIEGFLTYKISILAKLIDRRSIRVLAHDHNLKLAEWRVLAQLANRSPSTVRYLAKRMRMDRADVSRASTALISQGLVIRTPDENDARSALFSITPAGRKIYEKVLPSRHAENNRLDSFLTDAERIVFRNLLSRLTQELSEDAEH